MVAVVRREQLLSALILGVAILPLLLLVHKFWPFTVDDTFITLRYSAHLASGVGLTWNPEHPAAEGYTSLLWTIFLAAVHLLPVDAAYGAKVLSVVCTIATAVLVALTTAEARAAFDLSNGKAAALEELKVDEPQRHKKPTDGLRLVAVGTAVWLFTAQIATSVHAVSGMDTALFSLILSTAFLQSARVYVVPSLGEARRFAILCLLLGITRPEGNIASAVLSLTLFVQLSKRANATGESRRYSWQLVRQLGYFYCLPFIIYFGWRVWTYGLLFPLPFYVKAVGHSQSLAGIDEALAFIRHYTIEAPVAFVCVATGLVTLPRKLMAALLAAVSLFIFFLKPAPLMAYNHRYLYPIVPLLCVWGGLGCAVLSERAYRLFQSTVPRRAFSYGLCVSLVLLATMWNVRQALPGNVAEKLSYGQGLTRAHIKLGRRLAEIREQVPNASVALLDVGAVGYYSGWKVIDTFGLNEPHIARAGRADPGYVLGLNPELIVVVSKSANEYMPVFDYESALASLSQDRGYSAVRSFEFLADYHLRVLARADGRAACLLANTTAPGLGRTRSRSARVAPCHERKTGGARAYSAPNESADEASPVAR